MRKNVGARSTGQSVFRTINNAGLQRYYLAAKKNTIGEAVEMRKAYYQVEGS